VSATTVRTWLSAASTLRDARRIRARRGSPS
jgi:hypothetical protein